MSGLRCVLLVIGCATCVSAQERQEAPQSTAEQRLSFAKKAAEAYRFRFGPRDRSEVVVHPEPLLRWTNQVVREDDGMLFLWTEGAKGRPVAAAQFFLQETQWHNEFQSLSQKGFEASFSGERGGNWSWQPDKHGLEMVRATDSEAPAASSAQRLRQMKGIAEKFTAAVDPSGNFTSPEQLRTLTTPLYRYSAKEQGVLDGALFAIVQGTNPEIMILVEADARDPENPFWRYGFARMSCFYLRVYRGKEIVWQRDRAPVPTPDRASPYFFRQYAQVDGSADVPVVKGK